MFNPWLVTDWPTPCALAKSGPPWLSFAMLFNDKKSIWRRWLLAVGLGLLASVPARAEPEPPPAATVLWKFNLGHAGSGLLRLFHGSYRNTSSSTPAVAPDGTVYLGTFAGEFLALTPDGKEKWRFKTGWEIHSSPAVAEDGTVYFGSRDRHFYALRPDGSLKWKFATGGWVDSSPAIAADDTVYFGSWDKTFYALRPDGALKWKFATGGIVDSSPAIAADGTIYFGSHDRNFYALNPDGSVRWKFSTGGGIVSSPAIGADGVVYFSSLDGNLYALNPDGTARWRYHTGSITTSSPVLDAQGDIAIGNTNRIDVVGKDGKRLWAHGAGWTVETTAAAVGQTFYLAYPWHTLAAVKPMDQTAWFTDTVSTVTSSLTVGPDGTIYAGADNVLLAVRPPNPALPVARSPWPMFRANAQHTGRVNSGF